MLIVEDPTKTVKCRTAINRSAVPIKMNLCNVVSKSKVG